MISTESPTGLSRTQRARLTRRRAISIVGVALGLPAMSLMARAESQTFRWTGQVLGARASILLHHDDARAAAAIVGRCLEEVERLEGIFSLYRPESELSRLNRDGRLDSPSADLVAILQASRWYGHLSDGAFDVSIQSLWNLYAAHFAADPDDRVGPSLEARAEALKLVDFRAIRIAPERIGLDIPGMAITLNGIAQGYITDRVAEMLRGDGVGHILLDLGEMRGLDGMSRGGAWRIGIKNPLAPERPFATIELFDGALSTSGGYGTTFSRDGRHHHLIEPRSGESANYLYSVSVVARRATAADALSTAIAVMPPQRIGAFLAKVRRVSEPISAVAVAMNGLPKLIENDGPGLVTLKDFDPVRPDGSLDRL